MIRPAPRIIFLFVDGLGLGKKDASINPVYSGACPVLSAFLDKHSIPIDAQMGVSGLPQSATGQTAIFTGVNAPREVGRHVEGFPGPALRQIIERSNLYHHFLRAGKTATFANGYWLPNSSDVHGMRFKSVTTVAAMSALGGVRDQSFLLGNEAVCQDLTRKTLVPRGYTGPIITPETAAAHLLAIAVQHDLTVFEYFQTDRVGHSMDINKSKEVLAEFDRFLNVLIKARSRSGYLLVLTSDHGNIEDMHVRTHTHNPVPLAAVGPGAAFLKRNVKSLTDIMQALCNVAGV